jgi:hypothetical protein
VADIVFSIKTSQSNNAPQSLANGELAYSYSSNKLFIGQTDTANSTTTVEYIGGRLLVDKVANLEAEIARMSIGSQAYANLTISGTLRIENAPDNSVLFSSTNGVIDFATGSLGRVLQISSNGMPSFDDLNGGDF